jgi:hypothetical protein
MVVENEALVFILKDIFGSYYGKVGLRQLEDEKRKILEVLESFEDYKLYREATEREYCINEFEDMEVKK